MYFVGSSRRFIAATCDVRFGQSLEVQLSSGGPLRSPSVIMRLPLCRGAASSCTTSPRYFYVQVSRVRWGPAPDPFPSFWTCGFRRLTRGLGIAGGLSTYLSLLALAVCAFQNRVSTLRSGVHDHWPDWWTPVGVVDHEKSFCFYFLRLLSLVCAVLVKLLFLLQEAVGRRSHTCAVDSLPPLRHYVCFPMRSNSRAMTVTYWTESAGERLLREHGGSEWPGSRSHPSFSCC